MYTYFADVSAFRVSLQKAGVEPHPEEMPQHYPCAGTSCWSESECRVVWDFLYLTDPVFARMLVAYLNGSGAACPDCGAEYMQCGLAEDQFTYGVGPSAPLLTVHMPVWRCRSDSCTAMIVDHAGESLRDAAIAEYRSAVPPGAAAVADFEVSVIEDPSRPNS